MSSRQSKTSSRSSAARTLLVPARLGTASQLRSSDIRVVHAVHTFLNLTENWIYPQIVQTPKTKPKVYCRVLANRALFPLSDDEIYVDPPTHSRVVSAARLVDAIARRLGLSTRYSSWRLRFWRPQVIHAHFGPTGWQTLGLKAALRAPLITSFYGADAWTYPRQDPIWLERYGELFRRGDLFFVEGPAMRSRLVALGCPREKIRIHRIGVSVDGLPFRLRSFASPLRVIMLARFIEKKGLPDGLEACLRAIRDGVSLSVTLVGDAAEGDVIGRAIKEKLHELARQPSLTGRVTFRGLVPLRDARTLLEEHDIFLCPSKHSSDGDGEGGSPIALTEAMALGLLCIGTNHCDIPEIVRDGDTGLVCESGDVAAISHHLQKVATQPELARDLCLRGRRHVETEYSLMALAKERSQIYESLAHTK
jgi:colanic acid/amylovoran biosynthesis glycosyltransferase